MPFLKNTTNSHEKTRKSPFSKKGLLGWFPGYLKELHRRVIFQNSTWRLCKTAIIMTVEIISLTLFLRVSYFWLYKKDNVYHIQYFLTLSWRRPLSYRNQPLDLLCKSMDCFLYDNCLRYERVNDWRNLAIFCINHPTPCISLVTSLTLVGELLQKSSRQAPTYSP